MLKYTESTVVEQTASCRELTIADGVCLKAPEGKILFLTVDGIQKNIAPGTYTGDIMLTVADAIQRKGIMMGNPRPFGAAVVARDGKVCAEYSIPAMVKGGTVEDGCIDGAEINAMGDVAGGLDLIDGQWTVKDTTLNLSGYGDCNGKGAGIYAGIKERDDVLRWAQYCADRFPGTPLFLHGISMGGTAVLLTAGGPLPKQVKGVISDCAYTNAHDIVRQVYQERYNRLGPFSVMWPALRSAVRRKRKLDLNKVEQMVLYEFKTAKMGRFTLDEPK